MISSPVEIRRLKARDAVRVSKYLKNINTVMDVPSNKQLKEVISRGYGVLIVNPKTVKILGIGLTYETPTRNVLAFFYVEPCLRRKPIVGRAFKSIVKNLNKKLPIILTSVDISTFKDHVELISPKGVEPVYKWVGKGLYAWAK